MKRKKYLLILLILGLLLILPSCGEKPATPPATPSPTPVRYESGAGKVLLSEIMPKNRATIRDGNGDFPDWVELHNVTAQEMDLTGWTLDCGKGTVSLDGVTLAGGEYRLFFTKVGKNGEARLYDRNAELADGCELLPLEADRSVIRLEDGSAGECLYPTPGRENTASAYDELQSAAQTPETLCINEVCVENFMVLARQDMDYMDYVELVNRSGEELDLTGWAMTDDLSEPDQFVFSQGTLAPGATLTVWCDKNIDQKESAMLLLAPFSLDSANDRIYLTAPDGTLTDFTALKDIPYGMAYGRLEGENGFFYLDRLSPDSSNCAEGKRRVSVAPVALTRDGIYENVKTVSVALASDNPVYYTTDGSVPTEQSKRYTGPFEVDSTTVVRAIAVEDGAMPSRALTLNYFLNEGNSLPVVSVIADDLEDFQLVYDNAQSNKGVELPGVLSYYSKDGGAFTMGSGIKMHGYSTLNLPKKGLSFKFRGCYGQDRLSYDLFGDGGVTEFSDLILRAGGDQRDTIVKNEVGLNLAASYSDPEHLPVTRSRYVAVYINGNYSGVYALMEKTNEQWFADCFGVSKKSVTLIEEPTYEGNVFRKEVLDIILNENVKDPKVYERIRAVLDIDSLIDWTLIEGVAGNWDLQSGNLRYAKSSEHDGKWRLILYDLDQAFLSTDNCFVYVIGTYTVGTINQQLLKNQTYRQRFLERASTVLQNELSPKAIWAEYERLAAQIDAEVKIEAERNPESISYEAWKSNLEKQKKAILEDYDWYRTCAKVISHYCSLTKEQEFYWFGDI